MCFAAKILLSNRDVAKDIPMIGLELATPHSVHPMVPLLLSTAARRVFSLCYNPTTKRFLPVPYVQYTQYWKPTHPLHTYIRTTRYVSCLFFFYSACRLSTVIYVHWCHFFLGLYKQYCHVRTLCALSWWILLIITKLIFRPTSPSWRMCHNFHKFRFSVGIFLSGPV